jgi:hypothetical protein
MDIKISTMSGKLEGIKAINTNTLSNDFCRRMHSNSNTICSNCYSINMLETFRKNCAEPWQHNSDILSVGIIEPDLLPVFYTDVVRYHGHGELINEYHFINYINIALKNTNTFFVLWSKRKDIINTVLKSRNLPPNLSLIYSNPITNTIARLPRHFDKTFNVITNDQKGNFDVNCSGKCRNCMACYSRNNIETIIEVIK